MTIFTGSERSPIDVEPSLVTAAPAWASIVAWTRGHAAVLLIALATIAGLGLRLAAARGDLWLDELWSLDLVSHIGSPDQVFWNISHDNNHFLNSLWMYLVGQQQTALVYRLPSIVFSTAAIVAAARIGWRVNRVAAVAAAWLASCSYALVDYGSEARGYAGLILAILIAIDLSQTLVDRLAAPMAATGSVTPRIVGRERLLLGLTIALGTCAHLTMMIEAAILGLAATIRLKAAGRSAFSAFDEAVGVFRPSLLMLLPIIASIALGIAVQGQFTIGGNVPFTAAGFVKGYGGLLAMLLGLPTVVPPWVALVITAVIVLTAFATGCLDRRWCSLAFVALAVWPALVLAANIRNTEYARYFLVAGLLVPVFLAEIAGRLWTRGRHFRWLGVALVAAVCAGQMPEVCRLLTYQRGAPSAAVALMASSGPTLYRARNAMITEPVISTYAARQGVSVEPVVMADFCHKPAEWVVYDSDYGEAVPDSPEIGPEACRSRYAKTQAFPSALWSGRAWTLYRRIP